MTRKQRQKIVERQVHEMLTDFRKQTIKKVEQVLTSGMVSEALIQSVDEGRYLLAKAIIDAVMRERPYSLPKTFDKRLRNSFENIYFAV